MKRILKALKTIIPALVLLTVIPILCTLLARSIQKDIMIAGRCVSSVTLRGMTPVFSPERARSASPLSADTKEKRLIYLVTVAGRDDLAPRVCILLSLDKGGDSPCALQIPVNSLLRAEGSNRRLDLFFTEKAKQYSEGGKKALDYASISLCRAVESTLGIDIDSYFTVYLESLGKMARVLGSVDMKCPKRVTLCDGENSLTLEKGYNSLSANDVELIVKECDSCPTPLIRHVLFALGKKIKGGLDLPKIISLTRILSNDVATSLDIPGFISALSASSSSASKKLISLTARGALTQQGLVMDERLMTGYVKKYFNG